MPAALRAASTPSLIGINTVVRILVTAPLPATAIESLDPLASVGLYEVTPGSPDRGDRVPFLLQQRSDVVPGAPPVTGALGTGVDTTHLVVFGGGFTFGQVELLAF